MLIPVQAIIKEMPLVKNIQPKAKSTPNGNGEFKKMLDAMK